MLNSLQKELKKYGINLDQQTLATVLGAVVVLVVGVLAYGYFRYNQPNTAAQTELSVQDEGEVAFPGATVALPATHKVAAGDTLWGISEQYYASGYNYTDIASANDLTNVNNIEVGQSLKIPKVAAKQMTVQKALVPEITLNRIEGTSYTVVKGDYLWEIALRAYGDGYKWIDVAKANGLVNPGVIHADNVLTLPR